MTTQTMASFDSATEAGVSVRAAHRPKGKEVNISEVNSLLSNIRRTLERGEKSSADEAEEVSATHEAPAKPLAPKPKRPLSSWIRDVAETVVRAKIEKHAHALCGGGGEQKNSSAALEPLFKEIEDESRDLEAGSVPPPGRTHATDTMRTLHGLQMAKVDLCGQHERKVAGELARYLPSAQRALRAIYDGSAKQLAEVSGMETKYADHARSATREFSSAVDATLSKLDADWTKFLGAYFGAQGAHSMRYLVANANHDAPLSDRVQRFLMMERAEGASDGATPASSAADAAVASARSDLRHTDEQMERVVGKLQDLKARRASLAAGGASDIGAVRALEAEHGVLHDEAIALSGRRLRAQRTLSDATDAAAPKASGLHAAVDSEEHARGAEAARVVLRRAVDLEAKRRSVSTVGWRLHDVLETEVKDARHSIETNARKAMDEVRDASLAELGKAVASAEADYSRQLATLARDADLLKREVDPEAIRTYAAYWKSALESEQAAVRRGAVRRLRGASKKK